MTQIIPKWFKQTEIGVIPDEWEALSLWEVSEIKSWKTRPKVEWAYPVYGWNWIMNYANDFNIENETIIIWRVWAYCWCIYKESNNFWLSDNALWLVNNNKSNINYLFYLLIYKDLNKQSIWWAQPLLTQWLLKKLQLPLPPLPQQKSIAEILSSLDDKIELLEKQNKTLENIGQAIFKSWFVDFEGFDNDLAESEMEMIPRGWKVESAENIVNFIRWVEPWSKNYLGSRIKDSLAFIRVWDLLWNQITNFVLKDILKNKICNKNNILISFDWTVWRVAFWLEWWYSTWIRKIESELLNNWFLYFLFNSEWMQNIILKYAKWTTILHAWESIKYMNIIVPDKNNLNKINKKFDNLFSKMLNNKTQIQTLSNLRDSLLPRLMNGKVKV